MAERSGFFNAEKLANGSFDRLYLADSFAKYFASFISNGVFGGIMGALQVVPNGTFGIAVQNGQGYINGYWYENDSNYPIPLSPANTSARIDSVVLRLDLTSRSISLALLTGIPASSPTPVPLTRNNTVWELRMCNIDVPANATSITGVDIIDTRFDNSQCGLVHGVVDQLDTTTYGDRLDGFIHNYIAKANADYNTEFLGTIQGLINSLNGFINGYIANANIDYSKYLGTIQDLIRDLNQLLLDGDVSSLLGRLNVLESSINGIACYNIPSGNFWHSLKTYLDGNPNVNHVVGNIGASVTGRLPITGLPMAYTFQRTEPLAAVESDDIYHHVFTLTAVPNHYQNPIRKWVGFLATEPVPGGYTIYWKEETQF